MPEPDHELCDRFDMCMAEAGFPTYHASPTTGGNFISWTTSPALDEEAAARAMYRAWELVGRPPEVSIEDFVAKATIVDVRGFSREPS